MKKWLPFLFAAVPAWAEQRFPPPDFETGHALPVTTVPLPRCGLGWEWADAALLLVALGLAFWLVHGRRSRAGVKLLALASLVWFGFVRKGCVCAIGAVQNVVLALSDPGYALPVSVLIFFLAPLAFALFGGRVFCAAVCPQGALQDLLTLRPVRVPRWLEEALSVIPWLFLGAAVAFVVEERAFIICRYDPIVPVFRFGGSALMIGLGAAILALGIFIGRPYCRFLCPYGALLRMCSSVAKRRVRVTPKPCVQCALCRDACPYGAMREPVALRQDRAKARRRLAWGIAGLPILVAAGAWSGWLGAWAGLVIGVKILTLCLPSRPREFEPDQAACVACARCFDACPENQP